MVLLFADRSRWVTGRAVRELGRESLGFLVRDLVADGTPRGGADYPPLSNWVVLAAPPGEPPATPNEWLARLRPRFGQTLVILLVGFGSDRTGWRGWVWESDRISPLGGLRVVGPGMLRLARTANANADDDPARWCRVRSAVGNRVFAKIRAAEVTQVGCSRSGTPTATMLAALGVGKLTLIDGAFHATPDDLGANKALALARRLIAYRPDLLVRAVPHALGAGRSRPAPGHLALVVTCVDRDGPRLRVAHWARDHLTPHLDIVTGVTRTATGARVLAADVSLMLPGSGCVRCAGGLPDLDRAEYEFHAPPGALPARPPVPWNASGRLGSLISLNGLAASVGIQSWLDLLEGTLTGSVQHRLRWRPGAGLEVRCEPVTATQGCPICEKSV